jgi:thiamine-phosphate pyrophosphorylase
VKLPRLYAILDLDLIAQRGLDLHAVSEGWLDAGVQLIQLRAKTLGSGDLLRLSERLAKQTRAAGARFVVNDRLDVALLAGADGVHVGQQDLLPADIDRLLAGRVVRDFLVGFSTHNDQQIQAGLGQPVSYLAIGPVFSTSTKAQPDPVVGLEGVRRAAAAVSSHGVPLVAIGGIDEGTAGRILDAGATSVAIAGDLTGRDARSRARRLLQVVGAGAI